MDNDAYKKWREKMLPADVDLNARTEYWLEQAFIGGQQNCKHYQNLNKKIGYCRIFVIYSFLSLSSSLFWWYR